jgi:hypothetical protein
MGFTPTIATLDATPTATTRQREADHLDAIACRTAKLPVRAPRSADEILGYDERGLPG